MISENKIQEVIYYIKEIKYISMSSLFEYRKCQKNDLATCEEIRIKTCNFILEKLQAAIGTETPIKDNEF